MLKKLTAIGLILTMVFSSSTFIFAEETQAAVFFKKNIIINGEQIYNFQSKTPLFIANDNVYIPLTNENGNICGFDVEINNAENTINLIKKEPIQLNYDDKTVKKTPNSFITEVENHEVFIGKSEEKLHLLDLGENEVLKYGEVLYLPLRSFIDTSFGWTIEYNQKTGIYLSTDEEVDAKELVRQKEIEFTKNEISYIQRINGNLSENQALRLLEIIEKNSLIYEVDEILLLAVISKESRFNEKVIAKGGPRGLMQILPSTAKSAGISAGDLLNAEINIEFGAKYLANAIKMFDNNLTLGLCAYNQGSKAVLKGKYSTTYAAKVLTTYNSLKTSFGE